MGKYLGFGVVVGLDFLEGCARERWGGTENKKRSQEGIRSLRRTYKSHCALFLFLVGNINVYIVADA